MKKIVITAMACLVSSIGFSATATAGAASPLSSLGSAFKSNKHADASIVINSDDITMGYAGEDVAKRLVLPAEIVA